MQTWGIYQKQTERDITENLFAKYEKKKRGANSPESEIRELIAKLLNSSIPKICGRTKGWTKDELYQAYNTAIKFKPNPPALMNVLIKTQNLKIKQQLNKYGNN